MKKRSSGGEAKRGAGTDEGCVKLNERARVCVKDGEEEKREKEGNRRGKDRGGREGKKSSWEHKDKNIESDMTHSIFYLLELPYHFTPPFTQVAALCAYLPPTLYLFTGSVPSMLTKPRYCSGVIQPSHTKVFF